MRIRFDWSQYVGLAKQLASCSAHDPMAEAKQRSAISRAYYGVFIPARNHLYMEHQPVQGDKKTHKAVISEFKNSVDEIRQQIGKTLNRLRQWRNKADYDDEVARLGWRADSAVNLADETAKLINSL